MTSLRHLPKEMGVRFGRHKLRSRERTTWDSGWYDRASVRYLRRWLRGRNGVFSGPKLEIERDYSVLIYNRPVEVLPAYSIYIYWGWLEVAGAHGVAETDWIEEVP